jgi:hypothetical protein
VGKAGGRLRLHMISSAQTGLRCNMGQLAGPSLMTSIFQADHDNQPGQDRTGSSHVLQHMGSVAFIRKKCTVRRHFCCLGCLGLSWWPAVFAGAPPAARKSSTDLSRSTADKLNTTANKVDTNGSRRAWLPLCLSEVKPSQSAPRPRGAALL